jgi:glycosyltransferase involved in cell wall biosynthesis/SAM-dependent methyltransferase
MDRTERLTRTFTKEMRLIEIGASYNPLIPRAAGWNTVVVDHANRAELLAKYHDIPGFSASDNVEEVDFVWRDGPLIDAIPPALHGTFDGLIASHVAEHMPDLIGFLQAASRLLKPSGALVLALPDKRLCFDFFQPLTTTGALLDAKGRTRHSPGTLFDAAAYFAERGSAGAWSKAGPIVPFRLPNTLEQARASFSAGSDGTYVDSHMWRFTPASFQLLILELNLLGEIPWDIVCLEPADAVEFYAWLQQRKVQLPADAVATRRLSLLRQTVLETNEQVAQLEQPPQTASTERLWPQAEPAVPPISAVIPLYNGSKFIEAALLSVFAQTLSPAEVIVVDDGSTDQGPAVVKAMSERYPITLLTRPNGGQSSARNFGVAQSSGELIALLDQDDIWYPGHLEALVRPFVERRAGAAPGWVYSDVDEIDADGQMICQAVLRTLPTEHPKRNLFACLREDMYVLPSASLISRKAFDEVGGFDERLSGYEDDDLFLRLFRAGYANEFLETPLSRWRIYFDSSSYSFRMRRSCSIFTRKLLENYADDPKRGLFFHRDLLLPRFYRTAVLEYRDALASGDFERMREAHDELAFLVARIPSKRRFLGPLLSMARSQRAAQMAFTVRRLARPILRRMV